MKHSLKIPLIILTTGIVAITATKMLTVKSTKTSKEFYFKMQGLSVEFAKKLPSIDLDQLTDLLSDTEIAEETFPIGFQLVPEEEEEDE